MSLSSLNQAIIRLNRRADQVPTEVLVRTFVDMGGVMARLESPNHQIVFGRRGTGKTHVLKYLCAAASTGGKFAAYIDLSHLGSNGGLYSDSREPLAFRGTTLLVDVLMALHEQLMTYLLEHGEQFLTDEQFGSAGDLIDRLGNEATAVRVVGEQEREAFAGSTGTTEGSVDLSLGFGSSGPSLSAAASHRDSKQQEAHARVLERGTSQHHLVFSGITDVIERIVRMLPGNRILIVVDEWTEIPPDLQPLLADMLKRVLFRIPGVGVKIGAISERSSFQQVSNGVAIGLEVGADAFIDLDLDEFMVFGNDQNQAREFFAQLLFNHVNAEMQAMGSGDVSATHSLAEFMRRAFTQVTALEELVQACEGVPRDAINIAILAASRARQNQISVPHVGQAARAWYQNDKQRNVMSRARAYDLLNWIVDKVIGVKKARGFLLKQGPHPSRRLIDELFDARVLHLRKRGISSRDQPGTRYDAYQLDYGCYIERKNTNAEPIGLFQVAEEEEDEHYVQVPREDYRSIRNAILDLDDFESQFPRAPTH